MALGRALSEGSDIVDGAIEFFFREAGFPHEGVQMPHKAFEDQLRSSVRRAPHFIDDSIGDLPFTLYDHGLHFLTSELPAADVHELYTGRVI
jgi:hypothetical protein